MCLKNMQKSILIKIVSITSELQEQYCKSFLFVWFWLGSKEKGYLTISPLSSIIPVSIVVGVLLWFGGGEDFGKDIMSNWELC